MRTRLLLALGALVLAGCDALGGSCLLGTTGCALPGRWTLESVNGTPQTGSITISDGKFARDGFLDVPTGFASGGGTTQPERLMAPYLGTYLNDPDAPNDFKLTATPTLADREPRFLDVYGVAKLNDDNRFTYTVTLVRSSAGACCSPIPPMPLLKAGSVLVFRRK